MLARSIASIIALLICGTMLISCCCCVPGSSSDSSTSDFNNDHSSSNNKASVSEAKDAVKIHLGYYLSNATLNGLELRYVSCTYDSTRKTDDNTFIIKGTVTVRDEYGDLHIANYDATVEYDPENDDYDTDVQIGNFRYK